MCRLYHREVSRRCQEGVKEVSSRGLLADSLQEVVNDGLIGTEWAYHKYWMEHSLVPNGTLIGTEWEDKEETEPRRRIKNPWKRDGEGWEWHLQPICKKYVLTLQKLSGPSA